MIEIPRVKLRWVLRENGKDVLQIFVPSNGAINPDGIVSQDPLGWIDVPEFVERIEPR